MVGEGVLMECLQNSGVTEILSVSRRPTGRMDSKLKEYIIPDFMSLKEGDENLRGYDACFFCAGVSSVGMKEAEFTKNTYDTTMNFARALSPNSQMTFIYVSGKSTDSTEKGRIMWARVKGKTENDLMKLPFKKAYAFRPGFMKATHGQKRLLKYYKYFAWLAPVLKTLWPNSYSTLQQVAQAMIEVAANGYEKNVIEVADIKILSAPSL
jgi:NOL1/NOP2/fmu family ribosome biogenesis protein